MPPSTDPTATPNPFLGFSPSVGIPANEAEVGQLATRARELAAAFEANIKGFSAHVDAARRTSQDRHSSIVPTGMPSSQIAGITGLVEHAVERDVREYRELLVKETENTRTDQLRQLDAARARLAALVGIHPTPVAMLSAQGLGSDERSRYHQQIAHAGAAELGNLAKLAVATGNRLLGAAVLSRLDAMPREHRPFSAQQLAEALVGQQHRQIVAAHATADAAFQSALNKNRELVRGSVSPASKIATGLAALSAQKAAQRATPAPSPSFKGA